MQTRDLQVRVVADARAVRECLSAIPADFHRGPFQQAVWIDAWLAVHGASGRDLAVATVTEAGCDDPRFVLPFVLDTRSGVPCWTALDDGVSDYNAPLLAADFAPSSHDMRRIWADILDQLPRGDLVFIEKIPERIAGRRNPLLDVARLDRSRFDRHPLALDRDFATLRARFRNAHSLDRKRRKLGRKGRVDFVVADGAAAMPLLDRLMTWREDRYDARPITTAFYRRLLAEGDLARLGALRIDGEIVAGCFGIAAGGSLRLLVAAFDRRFKNWSPGLLAIEDMIAWAAAEGFDEFDFTIGSEPYKADFAAECEPLWEIREPLRLRGTLMLHLLRARRLAADVVRRALPGLVPVQARRLGG